MANSDRLRRILLLSEIVSDDLDLAATSLSTFMSSVNGSVTGAALVVSREGPPPVRVADYVERVVPAYSDLEFYSHFRMHRTTFQVNKIICNI